MKVYSKFDADQHLYDKHFGKLISSYVSTEAYMRHMAKKDYNNQRIPRWIRNLLNRIFKSEL